MGLEYARQYAEDGWIVSATAREPLRAVDLNALAAKHDNITVLPLDVTQGASVAALAERMGGRAIDVLISNASHMINMGEQSFENGNADLFAESFDVNAVGPFRLAQALIKNVRISNQKKIVFMGSTAGSTQSIRAPVQLFAYCPAKAALHSIVRGLHLNLSPEGIGVGLFEPGVVDTQGFAVHDPDTPAPYGMDAVVQLVQQGQLSMASPADAVHELRERIEELTPENGGELRHIDGHIIPW